MKFTHYEAAKDFSDDVLEVLNRHEIQNNLFYGNIGDGPNKFMASVKDGGGNVILTAIRTAPYPMVMYETDNVRSDEAVKFFARALAENNIEIDIVMAEKELAKNFCDYYGNLTGEKYHNNENLVLYVLEKVNRLDLAKGEFRVVNERDMFWLPYWCADFQPACNLGEFNLDKGLEQANKIIGNGSAFVWEDGFPVSLAAKVRTVSDCAFIGTVYTPPNLRGRGYSTACVSRLSQKLLGDGFKYCALYADCANPYSNRIYQKIGYREVFWYDQYKLTGEE
ncbi:MAG: GNAT family N-acetyltransferase [Oscillospiraceae bacterium]|nr:GNAT family N-acetyltransferase [Oscillospiraceae bacterium]